MTSLQKSQVQASACMEAWTPVMRIKTSKHAARPIDSKLSGTWITMTALETLLV